MRTRTYRARTWTGERRAFTLVEVLVVLVIVSMSLAMVVFSVTAKPMDHLLARGAAELAGWIRAATARAAERGEDLTIVYDLDAGELAVGAEGPSGRGEELMRHAVARPVRMEAVHCVGEEASVREGETVRVRVLAGGTCQPHLVVLAQPEVGARTLEVNPLTGDVQVLEGRREYGSYALEGILSAGGGEAGHHAD